MNFASDNAGPAHPRVMAALVKANEAHAAPYGFDRWTEAATTRIREVFEAPEATVLLVATGTAANSLALATLARPWDAVLCAETAHIQTDECNAPEFFSGGAKLLPIAAPQAKLTAHSLRAALRSVGEDLHAPQRGPVSITQATEKGTVYTPDEIRDLAWVAHEFGSRVHMDGARFANALVTLGCTPAEMTWRAGVDALSFGGTKNGLLGAEAIILFDPALGREMELRRKRSGHLFSKHRYLGAQMLAYLADGLWLEMARAANRSLGRLVEGLRTLGCTPLWEPAANLVFVRLPRNVHQRLRAAGAAYHLWEGPLEGGDPEEPLLCRLVCDWSTDAAAVERFLAVAADPPVPRSTCPC